ncbi:hypothetical protein ABFA07_011217 [Porites harrisoni]
MIGLGRRAAMEFYLGKLCYWMFFICSVFFNQVFSALQLNDCTEFKVIDPKDYDRDISSINNITKRPLGYMFGIAKYRGVQTVNLKNPCAYLTNLTSRHVEVMFQTLVAGKPLCVRDNAPNPKIACGAGAQNTNCWNPSQDTVIYEFYCDTGKGCDTDVQFWYRLTPSPVGISDVDQWCNDRNSMFPIDLMTAPPPVVKKTTVKNVASGTLSWNICLVLLLCFLPLPCTSSL